MFIQPAQYLQNIFAFVVYGAHRPISACKTSMWRAIGQMGVQARWNFNKQIDLVSRSQCMKQCRGNISFPYLSSKCILFSKYNFQTDHQK